MKSGNENLKLVSANRGRLQRLVGLPLCDIAKEIDRLIVELDKHHRLAADVRELLHNGGAGPNPSRLCRADKILMEIAGLPTEQPNVGAEPPRKEKYE